MAQTFSTLAYLAASVLFILALRGLSHPETSRRGNLLGMIGMGIAIAATLLKPGMGIDGIVIVVAGLAIGGTIVLLMVLIQAFRKMKPVFFDKLAESRGLSVAAGAMGGFSTMLANAAGPVIQLYFLARRLPKMEMIGVGARFFLLVNLIKIPLNARLALITPDSLWENAKLVPGVFAGIVLGRLLIGRVPQAAFEWMVVAFSAAAAVRLLW
jgi:NAD/NADP transhydrogenase beta subunit